MSLNYTEKQEAKFKLLADKELERESTDELLFYSNFDVKKELFGANLYFTNTPDFFKFFENNLQDIMSKHSLIFRGISKASYRLFNKAQRGFINNKFDVKDDKEYHKSIFQMLENAKNLQNGILRKYFNSFGVRENDVALLSFLQHNGAPTPLLDWTYDFFVATYFAINDLFKESQKELCLIDKSEINDFFSIYFMREDMPKYMLYKYDSLSPNTKNSGSYLTLKKKTVAHITEIYKSGKPKLFLSNNLNILSQNGIFIYNNSSCSPLEEVFRKLSTLYYLGHSPKDDTVFRTPILCINIHKSIAGSIRKEIKKRGYTNTNMFPNARALSQKSVPKNLL